MSELNRSLNKLERNMDRLGRVVIALTAAAAFLVVLILLQ